jgi:hypothetical protein
MNLGTITYDEASKWNTSQYVIPETGIYHIIVAVVGHCVADAGVTVDECDMTARLMKNNATILLSTYNHWFDDSLNGFVSYLDTGYISLVAGDVINMYVDIWLQATNVSNPGMCGVNFGTHYPNTEFTLNWDKRGLLQPIGETLEVSKWMPDMTQIDFVKGLKEAFNLRFFVDKYNQKIYIEPADTFYSTTIVDLTPFINFTKPFKLENLSQNYAKKIWLQWKTDVNDEAIKQYLISNAIPFRKEINNSSAYNIPGEEFFENSVFSYAVEQKAFGYYVDPWSLISKFGNPNDDTLKRPLYRNPSGMPVLLDWIGPQAFSYGTWSYNGTSKSTTPRCTQIDMNDVFPLCFAKTIHWIDRGKLLTVEAKLPFNILSQFSRVLNTAADEGFRPTYQLLVDGQYLYGIINKITTNGNISEIELLIK